MKDTRLYVTSGAFYEHFKTTCFHTVW